jgi:hypothetical protein
MYDNKNKINQYACQRIVNVEIILRTVSYPYMAMQSWISQGQTKNMTVISWYISTFGEEDSNLGKK